jgi:hypothetical protein
MDDDSGLARNTDPSPSHEAAASFSLSKAEKHAYNSLPTDGSWVTYWQWSKLAGKKYSSITPRGKSLCEQGLVERTEMYGYNDLNEWKNLTHFRRMPEQQESEVAFDLGERIKQVRMMEDYIEKKQEALDAELANHQKFVDMGRAEILAFLNQNNQKSANTEFGGCHWKPKITYRVEDKDAFRRHVIGAEAWELITWAAGAVNCEAFTEEHKMPPPGLVRNAVNILYITPPTKPKGKNKIVTP